MNRKEGKLGALNPTSFLTLLIILCLIGTFQLVTIRPGLLGAEDSALYLSHARNIALGRPYLATGYIYSIETAGYSPSAYPPVFPVMLAPLFRFNGTSPEAYKILMVCVVVLCLFAITLFYRDKIGPTYLLLLLILLGFNPYLTELKNDILSDIPFLLFLYVAFLLFGEGREPNAEWSSYLPRAIFAGFFSYMAYGTRAIGVGVILCVIAFSLMRYRKVTRFVITAALTFAVFAGLQSILVSVNSDYLHIAVFKWRSLLQNLHFYAGMTSYLWDGGVGSFARLAVFGFATLLALIGAFSKRRNSLDLGTIFFFGYGVFLLLWPIGQARYLLPLIPVYFYLITCGLLTVSRFVSSRSQTAAKLTVAVVIGILMLTYVAKYTHSDFGPSSDAWDSPSAMQLYTLVQRSTPKDAVILAGAPRALALYTGRRTAQFPEALNQESLTKYIAKIGATHLLVARADADQMVALCGPACAVRPVFSDSKYVLYMLSRSPLPAVR